MMSVGRYVKPWPALLVAKGHLELVGKSLSGSHTQEGTLSPEEVTLHGGEFEGKLGHFP